MLKVKIIKIVEYKADQQMFAWIFDAENNKLFRAEINVSPSKNSENTPNSVEKVLKELNLNY